MGFSVRCLTTATGEPSSSSRWTASMFEELGVAKYRGKSTARVYASSYLRFLAGRLGRLRSPDGAGRTAMSSTPTTFRISSSLPGWCRGWPDAKSCWTCTIRCPKRSRRSSPALDRSPEGALPRRAAERAGRAQGHLRQPSAARRVGRERHSRLKTFISMNVPDPRIFKQPRQPTPPTPRAGTLQPRLPRHDGSSSRCRPPDPRGGAACKNGFLVCGCTCGDMETILPHSSAWPANSTSATALLFEPRVST